MIDTSDWMFQIIFGVVGLTILLIIVNLIIEAFTVSEDEICGSWESEYGEEFKIYKAGDGYYINFVPQLITDNKNPHKVCRIHYRRGKKFYFLKDYLRYEIQYNKKRKTINLKQVSDCVKHSL